MLKKLCLFTALVITVFTAVAQVNIIPQPAEVNMPEKSGSFTISKQTVVIANNKALANSVSFLNSYLQQVYGFKLATASTSKTKAIYLSVKKHTVRPRGSYKLDINAKGISLQGNDEAGVFYAVQSLLQLLPAEKKQSLSVPFVSISDTPRFAYRGMHLDVCRHFFPVSFVKKYIDYLAYHKMNYFHWHLTEDQGWRIEIKKYPRLTQTGGYRDGTIIGHHPGTGNDNIRYGGYYTQQQVKDIVAYAAKRYITIIPEIEMPGHSSAAIAAYNWLSCFPQKETQMPEHTSEASKTKTGKKVQETWGVFEDIFCAGKDSTFLFLQDVLDEVMALFPSKYIQLMSLLPEKVSSHQQENDGNSFFPRFAKKGFLFWDFYINLGV